LSVQVWPPLLKKKGLSQKAASFFFDLKSWFK
jgi:hypothetical protein